MVCCHCTVICTILKLVSSLRCKDSSTPPAGWVHNPRPHPFQHPSPPILSVTHLYKNMQPIHICNVSSLSAPSRSISGNCHTPKLAHTPTLPDSHQPTPSKDKYVSVPLMCPAGHHRTPTRPQHAASLPCQPCCTVHPYLENLSPTLQRSCLSECDRRRLYCCLLPQAHFLM
jgi:hypothetical protein